MRSARSARRALAIAGALTLALFGCNLVFGIEDQGLRPGPEEAGAEGRSEQTFQACTRDQDCVAPNGCYTPHCDTVLGACTYALCEAKDRSCAMGTCDTRTFACSEPQAYGFQTTTYDLPAVTSGCGPSPESCVAAAFPFLLLGTRDSVVALRTGNLTAKASEQIPIADFGTKPQQLVASGRRIWVLGAVQGQTPPYVLPIVSIDIPSDPTATALRARTTLVRYPFPTAQGFPGPNGALFVTFNDPAQGFPAALVTGPLTGDASLGVANAADAGNFDASVPISMGSLTMYRTAVAPAGTTLVAASGARLVVYRPGAVFNLIEAAGTADAALRPDGQLQAPFVPIGPARFTQGPDGVVLMSGPVTADPPPMPPAATDCNCNSHERLQWVFPNAIATTTDVGQTLDHAIYVNPQTSAGACHQCALDYVRLPALATWIDKRTVLTAAAFGTTPAQRTVTDVRVLARDPFDGFVKRRAQTKATDTPSGNFATDRVALTSSSGIGYLVLSDAPGDDVSLSIFDPRCDPR